MNAMGLDLGTTTLSAVVVDSDTGAVLETANIPNGGALPARRDFDRIQDAEVIAERALRLVAELKRKRPIDAVGIDGQMHGVVYVNACGRAVSPLYTWQDQRGEALLGEETYAGALSRLTGYPVSTGYGMVTHYWHVVNGEVPEGAAKLCTIYDYVGMRLTGRAAPLMHVSSAASLGLLNPATRTWDADAVARAGMDPDILPEVTDAWAVIGRDADGVPVACGIGDNQASFIGAMREMEGGVLVNMGTGGQVSMLTCRTEAAEGLEVRPLGDGKAICVGSALCGGRAYALLEGFLRSCARLGGGGEAPLYEAMNRAGMEGLDDPSALVVDTRFNGTRAQPDLRGSICAIGTENFDAGHLIAGTLLGMAREMRGLYDGIVASGGAPARRLVGSGNGIRRNPALRRAFEREFGAEMRMPAHTEEAAYGAALTAMAASGIVASLAEAQQLIRYI